MDVGVLVAEIKKIPPVTRFLVISASFVTVSCMLNLVSGHSWIYHHSFILRNFEIWRIWSQFFLLSTGIHFLFDLAMLYRTSVQLEEQHYTYNSHDYAWQLILACAGLMALNYPLGSVILSRPFMLTLIYVSCAITPEALSSVFGLFTVRAKYWPFCLLLFDFLTIGPSTLLPNMTGIITGQAWYVLFWKDREARIRPLGRAPQWLKKNIRARTRPGDSGPQDTPYVRPQRPSDPTSHNWGSRGHRLGDA